MMLEQANCLIFDEPTSPGLGSHYRSQRRTDRFTGVLLFNSHDHQIVESIANRIIEFTPSGVIDRLMGFEDYFMNVPSGSS
jgi:ATPase subunit of ABC transporter with duplicated ATPase domains